LRNIRNSGKNKYRRFQGISLPLQLVPVYSTYFKVQYSCILLVYANLKQTAFLKFFELILQSQNSRSFLRFQYRSTPICIAVKVACRPTLMCIAVKVACRPTLICIAIRLANKEYIMVQLSRESFSKVRTLPYSSLIFFFGPTAGLV
jgi:hypothetical protein